MHFQNDEELLELAKTFEVGFLLDKMAGKDSRMFENAILLLRVLNQDSLDHKIAEQFYSENHDTRDAAIYQIGFSENPKMIPLLFTALDSFINLYKIDKSHGSHSVAIIQSVKNITHPSAIPFWKNTYTLSLVITDTSLT